MRPATREEIEALLYSEPFQSASLKLFFVPPDDEFMEAARVATYESTDKNHSTGAVVVKDGKIISMAANQAGFKHPLFVKWHAKWLCVRRWFSVQSGTKYWLCPGCAKSSNHAETRAATLAMAKYSEKTMGSRLYLYGHRWCCRPCCEAMIQAGITEVVLVERARDKFK